MHGVFYSHFETKGKTYIIKKRKKDFNPAISSHVKREQIVLWETKDVD